jgi:hypothetical protein
MQINGETPESHDGEAAQPTICRNIVTVIGLQKWNEVSSVGRAGKAPYCVCASGFGLNTLGLDQFAAQQWLKMIAGFLGRPIRLGIQ